MIIKSVANTPIRISEFTGDLFLSIVLSQVEFGRTESLDIEKINLEAVAIQATPHAKIAAITNKRITEYSNTPNSFLSKSVKKFSEPVM